MNEPQTTDEQTARPVRVPNVSSGAVSGLAHEVIGSAAQDAYDAEFGADTTDPQPDDERAAGTSDGVIDPLAEQDAAAALASDEAPEESTKTLDVPDDDLDSQVQWVTDAEDSDTAHARADAVFAKAQDAGDVDLEALSGRLTTAVYGDQSPAFPQGTQVPGTEVSSDTAGIGDAVNDQTGEVTQPGEQLPEVEGDGGTPLEAADGSTEPHAPAAEQDGAAGDVPAGQPGEQAPEGDGGTTGTDQSAQQ